jgi:EAL domain-containing protein (putative c-di-GMP-specific phosphodiesterase class I)
MTFSPALVGEAVPCVSPEQSRALERSLIERSFRFVYQPIVETESWKLFGYEALCRPADPALGSITDAIAAAEATGRMVELGRLLRELAVAPIASLPEPALLFVNLHPRELADPALVQLEAFMAPWAGRVVLEISESIALKDYEAARHAVRRLHDQGFRIALDDLGAGYSGLHALAQLEADFVKLDRLLVRDIHEDDRTSRLLKHILDYAETEGLVVIAEGIETEAEWQVVKDLGCPLMQGYFIASPERGFAEVRAHATQPVVQNA